MERAKLHKTVRRAMRGDQQAFEALYHEFARTILYHVRNLVYDRQGAEDVAQEVVVQMYLSIQTLKSPYAFTSWLHRIISNVCSAHNQKAAGKSRQEEGDEQLDALPDNDPLVSPECVSDQRSQSEVLLGCIGKLPPTQRQALTMYYYDEMSYKQIAAAQGITSGTVASNISKAKGNLERLLSIAMSDQGNIAQQAAQAAQPPVPAKQPSSPQPVQLAPALLIGPAIAEALRFGVEKDVPLEHAAAFAQRCDTYLAHNAGHLVVSKAPAGARLLQKAVMGAALAGALIIGVGGAIWYGVAQSAQPPAAVQGQVLTYTAEATIIFMGEDTATATNQRPSTATVVVSDGVGTVLSWQILTSLGETVAAGTGTTVAANVFEALPAGAYTIQWQLEDTNHTPSTISRSFTL